MDAAPSPTAADIDQLCINTIRTLSIDAIQKASSGHPGTPMALAPLAYVLWQRFLRFDPEEPIWPNRDRFVLSAGHASMLLYSLLHLTGVQAVDPDYETLGEPSVSLDDIKAFRQLDSQGRGAPRVPPGPPASRRPPARSGRASRPRSGWRSPGCGRPPTSTGRLSDLRLRRLRHLRRRRHDGGRLGRGGIAGRAPATEQPLLDLRQQPHLDRRVDERHLQRRRRRPLHGLWVERQPGRRRKRPRPDHAGAQRSSSRRTSSRR